MDDDDDEIVADGLEAFGEQKFYRGVLVKLQRGRMRGVLRAASGKEIAFEFLHAILLGDRVRWDDLHEGMTVAYDVGWTSGGLRVTAIKPID